MKNNKSKFILCLSISLTITLASFGQVLSPKELIIKASGGKSKWENTTYILYTASGNNYSSALLGERTFLLDRSTGEARFEGVDTKSEEVVVLFNYKTPKIHRVFKDKKERKNTDEFEKSVFPNILEQLHQDAHLLFLPILVENEHTKITDTEQIIVNAERLIEININHLHDSKGHTHAAKVIINSESGQVRQFNTDGIGAYDVSGYKDVGGGLMLPTIFRNITDSAKNCVFSTVASFTDMERSKFEEL